MTANTGTVHTGTVYISTGTDTGKRNGEQRPPRRPVPTRGEHTAEILAELDRSAPDTGGPT